MHFNTEKLKQMDRCRVLFVLVLASFALRLALRSNYLDDWDSVQFALALKSYSIALHQPHPPGYIVYVFLGRIFNLFLNDSTRALTMMSAFFGALSLVPVYLLAEKMFDKRVGLLSALMLSLTPAHLLFSDVAMSDIVSLFFAATTAYLLYIGFESKKYFYLGSLLLGITIGIRQTDLLLMPLALIVLIHRKRLKDTVVSTFSVLSGIAIWFIPLIAITGFETFLRVQREQGLSAYGGSTLNSFGGLGILSLLRTIEAMVRLFIEGWSLTFLLFGVATLAFILVQARELRWHMQDRRMVFLVGWLGPYILLSIFIYQLYIPRYLLPMFPPLAIVFSFSAIRLIDLQRGWAKKSLALLFSLAIIFMGYHSICGAYAAHTTIPAPVSAAEFVGENFDPKRTTIYPVESFRHFQFYLPRFRVVPFWWNGSTNDAIDSLLDNKTLVVEGDLIPFGDALTAYEFDRDHSIYPKHEHTRIYIIDCNADLVALNGPGWHIIESFGGIPTRWMNGDDSTLDIFSRKNSTVQLSFRATSVYLTKSLEIYVDDILQAKAVVPDSFTTINAEIRLHKGKNVLRLHLPKGCTRPCDIPGNINKDCRCLGLAVQNVTIARL